MYTLSDLFYNIFWYCIYPICIVYLGLEFHRYIFWRFMAREEEYEDGDREFHEPTIEMCSRCKNHDCTHRIAEYRGEHDA